MAALALSLASSISWGISDFLGGVQSRRMHVLAVVLLTQLSGLTFALISLPLIGGDGLSLSQFGVAAAGGAAGGVGLIAFYSGMATGSISVVSPIAGLGVAVPVAVGLARGEEPSALALAGILVAVAAVILVSYEESDNGEPRASMKPVFLALVAALGFGLFFVGVDSSADADAAWTIAAVRCGGVSVALGAVLAVRPTFAHPPGAWKLIAVIVVIGFFDVFANALFAVASTKGLLPVVAVGGSLYPAITVLLAYLFIGERLSRIRRTGVVLALCGILMIASGS
jgi:drug/metabolite transporter (DMT)-like permease